ncbi:MAG: DMT family transporter [Alphaproteobacteria bacterium]|nr:DMT family transporter [Alphaproteobacteria bacterium]
MSLSEAKPSLYTELALLGLLAFLWGASYPLIKIAVATIPPFSLIAARVFIAAILLSAVAWRGGHSLPRGGGIWGALLLQAFFNSIGAWTILAWGQQYIDSGLASILNSTSPIFVFLFTFLVTRHEAGARQKLIGMFFGIGGVCLIVGVDALAGLGQQVVAQLAVLLGAVLYAGAAIHGRRFKTLPPVVTAGGTMIWASICLIPLSMFIDRPWILTPSVTSMLATVALSVFSTAGALLIYFRLVRTLGSMGVASQSYLRPAIAIALGVAFLGEVFTPAIGLGLLAVIIGVAAINGLFQSIRLIR